MHRRHRPELESSICLTRAPRSSVCRSSVAAPLVVSSCIPRPFHLLIWVGEKCFVAACSKINPKMVTNQPGRLPSPPPDVCSVPCRFRGSLKPAWQCFLTSTPMMHAHGRGVLQTQGRGPPKPPTLGCAFWWPSFFVDPPLRPRSVRCLYANPYLLGVLLPDMDPRLDGQTRRKRKF